MSKKDKKLEYRLIEVVEVLSESDKSSWAKVLAKISWNNKPATMDIRTINMDTIDDEDVSFGKGISLDDGLTDYLRLFNVDDNVEQMLKINNKDIYNKLVNFNSEELFSCV